MCAITALYVLLFVPLYRNCNQKFAVPGRLEPMPGSRADVTSDLLATKPRNLPCVYTGTEKGGNDKGGVGALY